MIQVNNITYGYDKRHRVFSDFSLDINQGGIYGLLGKNGTGKSTLLYLMMGLLRPEQGNVSVRGCTAFHRRPEMLQDMFLVPEEFDLPRISLRNYVKIIRPFYPKFSEALLRRCLEGFDMDQSLNLGALSMGQKKKVYMCLALATNTDILLMDEPTNGLDILSKSQFRKVVISAMNPDKLILVSTHQVHDVERLLDHVLILGPNRVLLSTSLCEENEPVDLEKLFVETLLNA